MINLRYLHLIITDSLSKYSEIPTEFSAAIRNLYFISSTNLSTTKTVFFTSPTCHTSKSVKRKRHENYRQLLFVVQTFIHLFLVASLFSIMYLVTSSPPSSEGGFHSNSTDSDVILLIVTGPMGLPGLSVWGEEKKKR